ncbi:MAG: ABC transporter permease [Candidatus Cloacimonadales bacterium]|jgi:putative ABC transport system permease protein|nr:ABC transporter permease [Candidatus Cloacimonadota bacterium]MDD3501618.1 ABC transporter permease [Candidatus Cloacimonadota bacterium]MDX9978175.1 ABC transporter permease [Candidatus Cloacimonadales bacterium]
MAISLTESVYIGFQDFWTRKLRSLVTIIGIILGTMSIIVILSLVNGMNQETMKWMTERGGLAKITISRNWESKNPLKLPDYFSLKEVLLIKSLVPEVEAFNATIYLRSIFKYGANTTFSRTVGTFSDFEIIEEWSADRGRFIRNFDVTENNNVIVLGNTIKNELFGSKNPIGQTVTVRGQQFTVIGIMKYRFMESNNNLFSDNPFEYMNRTSVIPISTMINKFGQKDAIDEITIRAKSADEAIALKNKLEDIVLNLRRGQDIFNVVSAQEEAKKMQESALMFKIIFFFISSISLIVGGIVIMNIMLASVQERTREIGVRLAIGARRFDIFLQFLIQSVLITFTGGLVGVLLGVSIVKHVGDFLKTSTLVDINMIYIALAVSVGIGLIFGIFPSVKASNLDPVEALRYE